MSADKDSHKNQLNRKNLSIAYQGEAGANSHLAVLNVFHEPNPVACPSFEEALSKTAKGKVDFALIPIENSVAGRVADIHYFLPRANLVIVGEHFERIHHQLMGVKGAKLSDFKTVHSHAMALGQCRKVIKQLALTPIGEADTAGAAREVSEKQDKSQCAIAPSLAAEIYDLEILKSDIEDEAHNTTRFLILSKEPVALEKKQGNKLTSFIFKVRNVPAALYKAMGGFATNGVNMTKLESYQLEGSFNATMFYCDVEGHRDDANVKQALEELAFYSEEIRVLGSYYAHEYRKTFNSGS